MPRTALFFLSQFLPPEEVVFGTPSAARLLSPLDDLLRLISETKDLGFVFQLKLHGPQAKPQRLHVATFDKWADSGDVGTSG